MLQKRGTQASAFLARWSLQFVQVPLKGMPFRLASRFVRTSMNIICENNREQQGSCRIWRCSMHLWNLCAKDFLEKCVIRYAQITLQRCHRCRTRNNIRLHSMSRIAVGVLKKHTTKLAPGDIPKLQTQSKIVKKKKSGSEQTQLVKVQNLMVRVWGAGASKMVWNESLTLWPEKKAKFKVPGLFVPN